MSISVRDEAARIFLETRGTSPLLEAGVAVYKGRKYRLLWIGQTKFGYRAHLQFFDGTKDFWVDGRLVSSDPSGGTGGSDDPTNLAPHGQTCPECGSRSCSKAWNRADLCDED